MAYRGIGNHSPGIVSGRQYLARGAASVSRRSVLKSLSIIGASSILPPAWWPGQAVPGTARERRAERGEQPIAPKQESFP